MNYLMKLLQKLLLQRLLTMSLIPILMVLVLRLAHQLSIQEFNAPIFDSDSDSLDFLKYFEEVGMGWGWELFKAWSNLFGVMIACGQEESIFVFDVLGSIFLDNGGWKRLLRSLIWKKYFILARFSFQIMLSKSFQDRSLVFFFCFGSLGCWFPLLVGWSLKIFVGY